MGFQDDKNYPPAYGPIADFLEHLDALCDVDINAMPFACHKIEAVVTKDDTGAIVGREHKIEPTTACVFKPHPVTKKGVTWEEAGSFLAAGAAAKKWDWKSGKHKGGNLILSNNLVFDESKPTRGVVPDTIAIYVAHPIEVEKGSLVCLT